MKLDDISGVILTRAQYENLMFAAKGAHLQQELVDMHTAMQRAFDSIIPRVCGDDARKKYEFELQKIRSERQQN